MTLQLGILRLCGSQRWYGFIEFGRYGSGALAMILREQNTPSSECVGKPTVSLVDYGVDRGS